MTSPRDLIWARVQLPSPLPPPVVRAALTALAGITGQPRVVLEATGVAHAVSWRLGADRDQLTRVTGVLMAHIPGLRVEELEVRAIGSRQVVARLVAPGHRQAPLATDPPTVDTVTRGVLAVLASTRVSERLTLQVILGVRRAPQFADAAAVSSPARRPLTEKLGEHRFGSAVRFAATAGSAERAMSLIGQLVGALRPLQAPGVGLTLRRSSPARVVAASSPFFWPLELGVNELVPLLGWPVATDPETALPGVPGPHPRLLPVPSTVACVGRPLGVSRVEPSRPVAQKPADGLRHLHILGPNGVGKSTLLARLALSDIRAGHGVVVIDPKGDLVEDILARVPDERLDDVVVLDPREVAPVGIDCFRGDSDLAADVLLGVFHSLYADAWGPRTHDILHACLLSLSRRAAFEGDSDGRGVSLLMVPLLLTNPGFRRSITGRVIRNDPLGLGSFWAGFESWSEAERAQATAPLMNKLRQVLLRPQLRAVFGQRRPRFALGDVFTRRRILLVSLSEGTLGPEAAQLVGSLVVGLLWQTALARTAVPESQRHPVFVHIDEIQRYLRLPGDLGDALARARGLGVGFTLAHQHLGQLGPGLRDAVLANARSKVAFQLTASDARTIANLTTGQLQAQDFELLSAFQAYAHLLVDNSPTPWCSLSTEPLDRLTVQAARIRIHQVRARSAARYGQPAERIEHDLHTLAGFETAPQAAAEGNHTTAGSGGESLGRRRMGGAA